MYIAQKPCQFSGQPFLIGEEIPENMVDSKKVTQLTRQGIIARAGEAGSVPSVPAKEGKSSFDIPIHGLEEYSVSLTNDEIVSVTDALQATVEHVADIIAGMTSYDAVCLVHACDARKSVQKLANDKMDDMSPHPAEGGDS